MESLNEIFSFTFRGLQSLWSSISTHFLILGIPVVFWFLRKVVRFFKYIT